MIRRWIVTYAETYRNQNGMPRDVSDGRLGKIYEAALSDIPTEQLTVALNRVLQVCRFFPTPADIRAQLDQANEKGGELQAEHTWQQALGWIERYYHPDVGISRSAPELLPKITHAIRATGGMHMIFSCPEADLVWRKKDFIADYTRNEELGREEHLLTDGEAKRILANLRMGPPQPIRSQIVPAPEPPSARPSKSEIRAVLDRAVSSPVAVPATISDEELERRRSEQKRRLEEWVAARQKASEQANNRHYPGARRCSRQKASKQANAEQPVAKSHA